DATQLLSQPGRHERSVEDLPAGLRLLGEAGALRAAEQRLRARQQRAHADVVECLPILFEDWLLLVALGNVEAIAERPLGALDREGRDEPHRAPRRQGRGWSPRGDSRGACMADPDTRPRAPGGRGAFSPASPRTDVVWVVRP